MKGLFLVFIIILFIIYYSYDIVSTKVESNLIYVIGVYKESIVDKKFASKIIELATERDINLIVKLYDSYFDILKDSNTYKLDFAILNLPKSHAFRKFKVVLCKFYCLPQKNFY